MNKGAAKCPLESADARDLPGHGAKPAAVRTRAILALLSERSVGKAAVRCGVNEKTLRRWMSDDEEFTRQLTEAQRVTFQAGMGRIQGLTAVAIDTLATLLGPKMPPNVRLGAARTVVELGTHQHEVDTILRRLEEVEAHQRQQVTAGRRQCEI